MTVTRYMADLLDSTNEHVAEYLAALETAAARGKSRAAVINFHIDLLSLDFEMRFNQTMGTAKALATIANATPRSPARKRANALLRRTFADFDYFARRTSDRDLMRGRRGNDHNTVCKDLVKCFDTSLNMYRDFMAGLDDLPASNALRFAGRTITESLALDYEMLVEQFRDFQHDGRTTVVDDDEEYEEEPLRAAA
jgi:hypothetical protein